MNKKVYMTRPKVIEAIEYTDENIEEIKEWLGDSLVFDNGKLYIHTLEGNMEASKNDYIIRGIMGEFYPCKPDIFTKSYREMINPKGGLLSNDSFDE